VTGLRRLGVDLGRADYVVALAGNPNTGKSTVFNSLTGLRQHTGNWPGKTVARSEGAFSYADNRYKLVDLPGTYSLLATSCDEEIARDFLLFGQPDVTVIVVDATRLERNLNLVLQVLEITDRAVVCLNLMDEARRHRFQIDHRRLSEELGVPVVPTSARYGDGIPGLLEAIHRVASGGEACEPRRVGGRSPTLGEAVSRLRERLEASFPGLHNSEWVALRLLDGDEHVGAAVRDGQLQSLCHPEATGHGSKAAVKLSETDDGPREILDLASTLRWDVGPNFHQSLVETMYTEAARIADSTVRRDAGQSGGDLDRKLDRILTSRWLGFPAMVLLLAFVLWLTVAGANVPSRMLSALLLDTIHPSLKSLAATLGFPWWLGGLLIDGVYLATAWVVSVMLPPMAIFFPLFTLLEDFGYLPRVAFNLDSIFRRCGAHGKQALTMSMGFGCNAAGVTATRVIDSPRERLIAIVTNNFALCNGRWPTQILVAAIFLGALAPPYLAGLVSALSVVGVALLGVALTFVVSWVLSRTVLRGEASAFSLELPPYRPPRIVQTLYTSFIDRTIFVLWRAVVFAIPAGAVIWLVANVRVGQLSLAEHATSFLDPLGLVLGLNGVILLAYIVAIPANEIVIPTILMLTAMTASLAGVGEGTGVMFELESASATEGVLRAGGWTVLTAVNLMLFSLIHNPCSTTLYTVFKETRSVKWTLVAAILPLAMGLLICLAVAQTWRLFAGG
jgi:ferrous iron transport protein B